MTIEKTFEAWYTGFLVKNQRAPTFIEAFESRQPEIAALKAENYRLRGDAERLSWLEAHPRLGEIHVDGEVKDCYLYAVSGASGIPLRAIIDAAVKEGK